jgi:deoxyribose-phosphate aldolase
MSIAKYIDHTILKPTTTIDDIQKACSEAKEYSFAAVCIPPYFVSQAVSFLKETKVKLATVIGFPFGYNHYSAKVAEVEQAVKDGADELDMVMHIAAFKNGDADYIKKEVQAVLEITQTHKTVLKIIIESGLLSAEEIIRCCELYKNFNIDFLKTSTGYAEKGASLEAVALMRKHLPERIQIKASGGIKTFEFADALLKAGATRLGCSSSVAIVNGEKGSETGY